MGSRADSAVGAVRDTKNKVKDKVSRVENACKPLSLLGLQKNIKIISTHILIMEVDFCPVLCIPKVAVLQAFRGISHFVWYCKAVSDL